MPAARTAATAVHHRLLAFGLALLAMAAPALAQDDEFAELSLEQLMELRVDEVVGASRYRQKVTRAPASVSVVGAEEIERFGYASLAEILGSMHGLYVSNDRNYSYLGVRGFLRPGDYNSRVLVLVDGHRMNDAVYDGAFIAREAMVDVGLIERVEFIRGPSSSIYGSSAFFGVVNVVTKRATALPGTRAGLLVGSFGTHQQSFSQAGQTAGGTELLLAGSHYRSAGQRRLYYPEFDPRRGALAGGNDGVAAGIDHEQAQSVYASARRGGWTLAGFGASRDKQIPTASYGTVFNDGRARTVDRRLYLDLQYEQALGPELQLLAHASFDRYTYYGDYPYDLAEPGAPAQVVLNQDETLGQWLVADLQLTRRLGERHTLLLGTEYRANLDLEQRNFDAGERDHPLLDERHHNRVLGIYAQGEFALGREVTLNAGLRFDDYQGSFGSTVNPRLGLIWAAAPATTVKALYGRAFRAPNTYETDYYPVTPPPGAGLQPETIRTYELVGEHYFGERYRLLASLYRYDVAQLITQGLADDGELFFVNRDRAQAHGLELEVEGKYDSGLLLRASYALQRSEDGASGAELSSSPRTLARLNLLLPLGSGRLSAALQLQYQGSMATLGGARTDSFVLAHFNLQRRDLVEGLDLALGVHNLFDTEYGYPGAQEHRQDVLGQDGRSIRIQASYRF